MKKRIVAFLLVVVLTMALMLPTLAATASTHGVNCDHVWATETRVLEKYQSVNAYRHRVYYHVDKYCPLCGTTVSTPSDYYEERHTTPCQKCGNGVRMVQE